MDPLPKRRKVEVPAEGEEKETMRFDDPDPRKHDVVLVVKRQKFYCCKSTLAKHAEKFETMFYTDSAELNMKEIELNDPQSSEEFQAFLELIHGLKSLNDENVPRILRLSVLWSASIASNRCVEYLTGYDCKLRIKGKFKLACETSHVKLMTLILDKITRPVQLIICVTEDMLKLNQPIIGMILKKSLELSGEWPTPEGLCCLPTRKIRSPARLDYINSMPSISIPNFENSEDL